jgi:allantoin racemase
MIPASFELVQQAGLKDRLASIRAVEIPVLELTHNREQTLGKLVKIGSEAMKQDRANVLVLGCMSMAFMQVAEEMQQALGIPVINPAKAALKMAEALVSSNFTEAYRSQF